MPRAVQVHSSGNLNLNTRGHEVFTEGVPAEESEDEDALNRNYNQKQGEFGDAPASMLRFPINYDLYNVTYSAAEDERYCLKCNIGGQEVRFKKDARVWLHKSSERKRKPAEAVVSETGPGHGKNVRLHSTQSEQSRRCVISDRVIDVPSRTEAPRSASQYIPVPTGYGPQYRIVDMDDADNISDLGDSDAELTYSGETSPAMSVSFGINKVEQQDGNAPLAEEEDTVEMIDVDACESEKSIPAEEKTSVDFIGEYLEKEHIDMANASDNNNRIRSAYYCVARRIAPAIVIEESFNETLLESAVNTFNHDRLAPGTRRGAKSNGARAIIKSGSRLSIRQVERKRSRYNLRNGRHGIYSSPIKQMDQRKRVAVQSMLSDLRKQKSALPSQLDPHNQVSLTPGTSASPIPSLVTLSSDHAFNYQRSRYPSKK